MAPGVERIETPSEVLSCGIAADAPALPGVDFTTAVVDGGWIQQILGSTPEESNPSPDSSFASIRLWWRTCWYNAVKNVVYGMLLNWHGSEVNEM